ncbi:hypothetical protein MAR_016655, partial [Mya arenaria]
MLAWRFRRIWTPGHALKKGEVRSKISHGQERPPNASRKEDDDLEAKDNASQSPGGQDYIRHKCGSTVPDYEDGVNPKSSQEQPSEGVPLLSGIKSYACVIYIS